MRHRLMFTLVAAGLMVSTAASAQVNLKMGGEWWSNRGPLIDIPLQGGAEFRNPLVNGKPCFLQTGCLASFKQKEGGVPAPYTVGGASAVVTTNGTAPATFNIPVGAFSVNSAMNGATALVTLIPTVVQLQSSFQAVAPGSAGITAMTIMTPSGAPVTQLLNPQTSFMGSRLILSGTALVPTPTTIMGAPAQPRRLRADAWTTQTGRLSPDFAFCQGAATGLEVQGTLRKAGGVVNCTTPNITNDPAQGPYGKAYNGIVSYTGGPNRFGGTMMMLLNGGGTVAIKVGAPLPPDPGAPAPFSGTEDRVCFQPIGAPGATGLRNEMTGAGYAFLSSAFLQGGPCFRGYRLGSTMITQLGPQLPPDIQTFPTPGLGTVMVDLNAIPPDQEFHLGFPFTTGTVEVFETAGPTDHFTVMGSLNTSMGEGNITLVAGGLSHRVFANTDNAVLNVVHMAFTPEPGPTMMLGGALLAIGALYYGMRRGNA
ncbi:MAG: hypothetical protein H6748_21720 [Spirochaetaceae bacterium]|nr:hypothetical protein [Myxococcales bacterium]MCB9726679.1 hypothetical protein [Spirochaetaceae bacterium]